MRYALFVYDTPSAWHGISTEQRHALHAEYHALAGFPGVIGHYRFRRPEKATTVCVEEDQVMKSPGPLLDAGERTLGALYMLESDDYNAVLEFAARIPAVRMGGAVELRPIVDGEAPLQGGGDSLDGIPLNVRDVDEPAAEEDVEEQLEQDDHQRAADELAGLPTEQRAKLSAWKSSPTMSAASTMATS